MLGFGSKAVLALIRRRERRVPLKDQVDLSRDPPPLVVKARQDSVDRLSTHPADAGLQKAGRHEDEEAGYAPHRVSKSNMHELQGRSMKRRGVCPEHPMIACLSDHTPPSVARAFKASQVKSR